jgi:hypothetical protein
MASNRSLILLGHGAATLAIFPAMPLQVNLSFFEDEEANVNLSLTTVVLSADLLEENVVPMGENAGQPDEVGYAADEDEEDEEDVDDLDEDDDQEDEDEEELDDEDLDYEWEEVPDEDEDDNGEEEEE